MADQRTEHFSGRMRELAVAASAKDWSTSASMVFCGT
jgi:hypothetical protein